MNCENCGIENADGAKFCAGCGSSLTGEEGPANPGASPQASASIKCAKCGADNSGDLKFCTGCGAALQSESPDSVKDAEKIAAELKETSREFAKKTAQASTEAARKAAQVAKSAAGVAGVLAKPHLKKILIGIAVIALMAASPSIKRGWDDYQTKQRIEREHREQAAREEKERLEKAARKEKERQEEAAREEKERLERAARKERERQEHAALYQFTDNGNGTVSSGATGLMWQKDDYEIVIWRKAISYCDGLNLAGYSDWRLPSRGELKTLIDDSKEGPNIDTAFFPNTSSAGYWVSDPAALHCVEGCYIDFDNGLTNYGSECDRISASYARCVRGGQ